MIDLTHPCLTLPLISAFGVITSLAGIAVIEGIMKREEAKENLKWLVITVVLFAAVTFICYWWFANGPSLFSDSNGDPVLSDAGATGDMFGGLTSWFSGLAFAALVVTLFMQRRELVLQRRELEQSRHVFQRQKFESTYFHLLKLFRDYVDNSKFSFRDVSGSGNKNTFPGADLLTNLASENWEPGPYYKWSIDLEEHQRQVTGNFRTRYDDTMDIFLGPYFRLLWNCVRLVDGQKPEDMEFSEKLELVQYLRSTLSPAEVKLLGFYGLSEVGKQVGEEYIARYQLIKYLKVKDAEDYPFLVKAYGPDAFGDRYETVEGAMRRGLTRNTDREQ